MEVLDWMLKHRSLVVYYDKATLKRSVLNALGAPISKRFYLLEILWILLAIYELVF